MHRLSVTGLLLAALLFGGCGTTVVDDPSEQRGGAGAQGTGGAATSGPSSTAAGAPGGGGGHGGAFPPVDDTGTLTVDVHVGAYGLEGVTAEQVEVGLDVTVHERETGKAVMDAIVTGGPPGRPTTLPYDVYSWATYGGPVTGYERTWEFSIVRGDDHLEGLVLVGPSFQSVTVSLAGAGRTIAWSPSQEPGVRAVACARSAPPADPAEHCVHSHDGGSLFLAPVEGGDDVTVERRTKAPVGVDGLGVVAVTVALDAP